MTKQQFRLLVVFNQLLLFGGYVVGDLSDAHLPPELQTQFVTGASVMDGSGGWPQTSEQYWYWLYLAVNLATLAAAAGLCLGRRWGRTLFLACYVIALGLALLTPVHAGAATNWANLTYSLYGTTEGMILALAYFSHLRRMFRRDEREDDETTEDEAADSA